MPKRYISRDGELYHAQHKYVSRKWKNGRWVYEYDIKGAVSNLKSKVRDAVSTARSKIEKSTGVSAKRNAEAATKYAVAAKADAQVNARRALNSVGSNGRNGRTANMTSATAAKNKSDERAALRKQLEAEANATRSKTASKKARQAADDAVAKYKTTALGKLEASAKRNKAKFDKLMSKLKDRKKDDNVETKKTSHKPTKVSNATVKRKSTGSIASGAKGLASTARSKPRNVSQEYLDELNYNSGRSTTSSTKSTSQSKPRNASSEYLEELEYNKKRNKYR